MQITIDTERDDLDQVARVVDALRGLTITGDGSGQALPEITSGKELRIPGVELGKLYIGDAIEQLVEDDKLDPSAVFGNVKGASLFDTPEPPKPAGGAATLSPTPTHSAPDAASVDAAGTPWDERIHASTKTKVADGTWKKKRGVDQELYDEVMEEISGSPTPPAPAITPVQGGGNSGAGAPPPVAPPTPPAPPVTALDFPSFVKLVTNKDNNISAADISAACQAEGLASFPLLQQQPDKIPAVAKRLGLA